MMPIQDSAVERAKPGEASVHLDQMTVPALKAPASGSAIFIDTEIPGFCCQVTYTGTKTFRLRYRKRINGKTKWFSVKLGRWRSGSEPRKFVKSEAEKKRQGITAGEARAMAAEYRRAIDRGENPALEAKIKEAEQVKVAAGAVLVSAAYKQYIEWAKGRARPMKAGSLKHVEGYFANHIIPFLGARYLSSLVADDVAALAKEAAKERKKNGRMIGGKIAGNRAVAHLSAFLTWAVKRDLIPENVAKKIDRRDVLVEEAKRDRYLSKAEWAALMHELGELPYWVTRGSRFSATKTFRIDQPQVRQLVSCEALRVGLLTGSRKGEVLQMRWADVDLDEGWWTKPKETTKAGRQHDIALPQMAIDSLQRIRAAHPDPIFVFPGKERLEKLLGGKRVKGEEGGHVKDIHQLWGKIRDRLGMSDVRIHDLRHTAASVLISNGASLYEVGQQLGHSQAQTTMRYAHLLEEAKRKTASRMDAFVADNPKKPHAGRG